MLGKSSRNRRRSDVSEADVLTQFRARLMGYWLPAFCDDLKRNYSLEGFRESSMRVDEADARDCMRSNRTSSLTAVVAVTGGRRAPLSSSSSGRAPRLSLAPSTQPDGAFFCRRALPASMAFGAAGTSCRGARCTVELVMTILVGTASWADKSLVDSGKFYPPDVTSPDARPRYYASQFPGPHAGKPASRSPR